MSRSADAHAHVQLRPPGRGQSAVRLTRGLEMASVADLVEEPSLQERAVAGAYQRGAELAAAGSVQLQEFGPLRVTATVGAEEVELRAGEGGLESSCSCRLGQGKALCEHAVAVAIVTWQRSPSRRT